MKEAKARFPHVDIVVGNIATGEAAKMLALSIPGAKDICIELNSLSKSSNMPGWRIGMVATNSIFMQWILRVKSNMPKRLNSCLSKGRVIK